MKKGRKIYDPAFKSKAVALSNERANISELARELGIKIKVKSGYIFLYSNNS
ncbi:MAG TPA: transposase [Flavobacterium sp.]|nr:transposase [Flavobacterium sp.]